MPPPTAHSLVLDLLATLRRGSMPVRALIEAGALFGLEANNVRVALARLFASGRVERDERGRYRLGPETAALGGWVRSWRSEGRRQRPWQGDWVAVHAARLGRGPARRRRERALDLLGFRELEAGLAIRPDNLTGGISDVRNALVDLASGAGAGASTLGRVFAIRELDPESDAAARQLWDTAQLEREALARVEQLRASESRLPGLSRDAARVETFLVGGAALRQLVRHPLLPPEILDPAPLEALHTAMRRYDRLGRDCWADFLARHDVPHRALAQGGPMHRGAPEEGVRRLDALLDARVEPGLAPNDTDPTGRALA